MKGLSLRDVALFSMGAIATAIIGEIAKDVWQGLKEIAFGSLKDFSSTTWKSLISARESGQLTVIISAFVSLLAFRGTTKRYHESLERGSANPKVIVFIFAVLDRTIPATGIFLVALMVVAYLMGEPLDLRLALQVGFILGFYTLATLFDLADWKSRMVLLGLASDPLLPAKPDSKS